MYLTLESNSRHGAIIKLTSAVSDSKFGKAEQ